MVPIIDYGEIALVVPMIAAVGSVMDSGDVQVLQVFMTGRKEPLQVRFESVDEANAAREDLVAVIAHYYLTRDLGPDVDYDDFDEEDLDDDDSDDQEDTH